MDRDLTWIFLNSKIGKLCFRSWLYVFCARCHGRDDTPSWEPPGWRRACPQPFCPSYRKFARVLCLFLLGLLLWGIVYTIMGDEAAPGGQLFGLAALTIAAHFGGWLFSLTTLPALIGMLITGIILQNIGLVSIEGNYTVVVSNMRWVSAFYFHLHCFFSFSFFFLVVSLVVKRCFPRKVNGDDDDDN